MNMKTADEFREIILRDEKYLGTLDIVRENSSGKIWLLGGAIYGHLLFGEGAKIKDYDYIADKINEDFVAPAYDIRRNHFGGVKCVSDDIQIDIMDMSDVMRFKRRRIEVNIQNYLKTVPFNIQSIVYDVDSGELFGDVGLSAIEEGVLRVNDLETARNCERTYSKSIEQMLSERAKKLGFDYDLIRIL